MTIYLFAYFISLICLLILLITSKIFFQSFKTWQKLLFILSVVSLIIPVLISLYYAIV